MKIRGAYLLSRRSIARMVAAITAALLALYSAATAEGEALVRRIHNATIALVTLDSQMVGRSVVAVVPDTLYLESKSLYLTLRRPHAAAVQPRMIELVRGVGKPRGKRGIGGKGPKTEYMKRQLRIFGRFLAVQKYDGDESRLYALANQCWLTNRRRWDKARLSAGQRKGYSSAKVLADAHRKAM